MGFVTEMVMSLCCINELKKYVMLSSCVAIFLQEFGQYNSITTKLCHKKVDTKQANVTFVSFGIFMQHLPHLNQYICLLAISCCYLPHARVNVRLKVFMYELF